MWLLILFQWLFTVYVFAVASEQYKTNIISKTGLIIILISFLAILIFNSMLIGGYMLDYVSGSLSLGRW
jgi:hypothetical protein